VLSSSFSVAQVHAFCDGLRLFKLGYSWGGPISLVMTYNLSQVRRLATPQLQAGHLIRLCIGLESVEDLQADLLQSMQQHLR
jgi:cystathionine beta-lyase